MKKRIFSTSDFDVDVQRVIKFWENERRATIIISACDDQYFVSVFPIQPGTAPALDIPLCNYSENKYRLISAIRNYFKK